MDERGLLHEHSDGGARLELIKGDRLELCHVDLDWFVCCRI
jgi:hypothetical protein